MATGYEVKMYNDIGRIARSLEALVELLRRLEEDDSSCASGCKPSEGDVCGGPRCG